MSRIEVVITDADEEEQKILSCLIRKDRTLEYYNDKPDGNAGTGTDHPYGSTGPDVIFRGTLAGKITEMKILQRSGKAGSLPPEEQNELLETEIFEIFQKAGIPANIKGHAFLKDAILLAVRREEVLFSVTKKLYPSIAGKYETTPLRVERAIRHAIETAWERGTLKTMGELCGLDCAGRNGRPTNTEFISSMAKKLRALYLSSD